VLPSVGAELSVPADIRDLTESDQSVSRPAQQTLSRTRHRPQARARLWSASPGSAHTIPTSVQPLDELKVLLVHDEGGTELARTLARDGHEVLVVSPHERAARFLGVFIPHVIVVADADAAGICRRLRGAAPYVAIVALVPGDGAGDRAAVLDAGADDCLSIPVSRAELTARVRATRRRRALIAHSYAMPTAL
jgi:PleD family two-component response regulator